MCCILLPCTMLYSSYMLHLLIDTCQEDAEKLWCESLCQYIEHLCLQKLSLLGTQIFRRKNLKRNQFFQRTTFQFLMHDSLLPRKRLLEFLFFKKKIHFFKICCCYAILLPIYHINFRKQRRTKNCENKNT